MPMNAYQRSRGASDVPARPAPIAAPPPRQANALMSAVSALSPELARSARRRWHLGPLHRPATPARRRPTAGPAQQPQSMGMSDVMPDGAGCARRAHLGSAVRTPPAPTPTPTPGEARDRHPR